jgi:hypothetical protein
VANASRIRLAHFISSGDFYSASKFWVIHTVHVYLCTYCANSLLLSVDSGWRFRRIAKAPVTRIGDFPLCFVHRVESRMVGPQRKAKQEVVALAAVSDRIASGFPCSQGSRPGQIVIVLILSKLEIAQGPRSCVLPWWRRSQGAIVLMARDTRRLIGCRGEAIFDR